MSDRIPFDIQEEIMKRLSVKSLVRFRSVSKAWKSLIDSSDFIAAHTDSLRCHTSQPHHLFILYENPKSVANFVTYIDDDTFPKQRSLLTLPPSVAKDVPRVIGSSRGLVCLSYGGKSLKTIIWNPSIRKSIRVPMLTIAYDPRLGVKFGGVGFGVCPVTNDPKIVFTTTCYQGEVMLYTLSSGKWRRLYTNLPAKPFGCGWQTVVTDRFIYSCGGSETDRMIISFDLTNESFQVVDLPDSLVPRDDDDDSRWMGMYKLRERERESSIAVVQCGVSNATVWMMMVFKYLSQSYSP